jgi:hypothetical protein
LARAGIVRTWRPRRPLNLDDRGWLAAQLAARRSQAAIARELGCKPETVRKAVQRHGLHAEPTPRPRQPTPRRLAELNDRGWLRQHAAAHTAAEIARLLRCSTKSVTDALNAAGIAAKPEPVTPPPPPSATGKVKHRQLLDRRGRLLAA